MWLGQQQTFMWNRFVNGCETSNLWRRSRPHDLTARFNFKQHRFLLFINYNKHLTSEPVSTYWFREMSAQFLLLIFCLFPL